MRRELSGKKKKAKGVKKSDGRQEKKTYTTIGQDPHAHSHTCVYMYTTTANKLRTVQSENIQYRKQKPIWKLVGSCFLKVTFKEKATHSLL